MKSCHKFKVQVYNHAYTCTVHVLCIHVHRKIMIQPYLTHSNPMKKKIIHFPRAILDWAGPDAGWMESEFTNQSTSKFGGQHRGDIGIFAPHLCWLHVMLRYRWCLQIDLGRPTSKNMGDFFGEIRVNLGRGSPWYNLLESQCDFIKSDLSSKPQWEKQEVPFHYTCWVNDRIPNKEKFHYSNQRKVRLLDSPKFITQDEGGNRIPVSIWIPLATVPYSQGIPKIAANLREPTDLFNLWLDLLAFILSKHLENTKSPFCVHSVAATPNSTASYPFNFWVL